ncbi:unnamed protein product [Effrenium voratum]|nr:unnamed protein product [Effrenium voratum]
MEKSFEEAIRSEEEISTMQVVQGLRGAAEKGAALRVDKKEVSPRPDDFSPTSEAASVPEEVKVQQKVPQQTQEQLEAMMTERERLLMENKKLKAEKENLILEGTKMSRRVQSVEERMKAGAAELRRAEQLQSDSDRAKEQLQNQLSRQTAKVEKAEAQSSELRAELRRVAAELESGQSSSFKARSVSCRPTTKPYS